MHRTTDKQTLILHASCQLEHLTDKQTQILHANCQLGRTKHIINRINDENEGGEALRKNKYEDLEQIYIAFAEPLYYYLLKLSGSPHIAEELVQETFFRATLSLDLYEDGQVRAWLYMVARNAYLDEWRKRRRWGWVPFSNLLTDSKFFISPYGIPEDTLDAAELSGNVKDIMSLLPESYRSILYLREFEEFSYSEIAHTLALSESQVKVNLHRARARFKQLSEQLGKKFY